MLSTPASAARSLPRARRGRRPRARRRRNGGRTWNPPLVRFVSHHTTMQPPLVKIRPLATERKLSRRLSEQLAEQIKSGRFSPGARLPTEQELTRVARTVVREAVAALRAEGLVVTRQGVGAFVSAEPQRAPFRIDPERMQSLDEVLNVMELRLGVEIESAGLAAERASRAQVRTIAAALETIDRAAAGGKSAVDEDLALHRAIAEATSNAEFPRFLQFIGRHLIPRRTVSGLPEQMGGRKRGNSALPVAS